MPGSTLRRTELCTVFAKPDGHPLRLNPIDLDRHFEFCVSFLRDSMDVSFGGNKGWNTRFGPTGEAYRRWLDSYDGLMYHAWIGSVLIGELMFNPSNGYLQHIYVVPRLRRKNIGLQLHHFFLAALRSEQTQTARVKVARVNLPALAFYRSLDWRRAMQDKVDSNLDLYTLNVD